MGILDGGIDRHALFTVWQGATSIVEYFIGVLLAIGKALWQALDQNLDLFFVALRSPRLVLRRWKRDSTETVRRALVFSIVPVLIGLLIELPYWAFYLPDVFSWSGIAGMMMLDYVQTLISVIVLFIVGWLFRGKASFRDCIAANLVFMANIIPANDLMAWLMKPYKVLLCARVTGTWASPSWEKVAPSDVQYYFWVLEMPLLLYFLLTIMPAIRHIQRVGWFRAFIIYFVFFAAGAYLIDTAFKPLFARVYAPVCA